MADIAGPLRVCALILLQLKGDDMPSPKVALENLVIFYKNPDWLELPPLISQARETKALPAGRADIIPFHFIELLQRMRADSECLS